MTESPKTLNNLLPCDALFQNAKGSVFIAKDGGFTSVGVAVALLLAITLLFTATQVRWVQSTSADIQYVADSAALAGGNVVGEFVVIARIADAVVLSLSLFGLIVYGIAIVVSCIPYCQEAGLKLMEFGKKVFETRDKCATNAAKALNNLQKALPFLAAVNAASVVAANSDINGSDINYYGLAITLPLNGEDIVFPSDDEAQNSGDAIADNNERTAELTDAAEQAKEQMQSSKREAYLADCGNAPNYCQYERANRLAGMTGSNNPQFSSVDTWQFDYAFSRAKAYYYQRLAQEVPAKNTLEEQVRSFARKRFYLYADRLLNTGWCYTTADGTLEANFPLLPKNNDELRQTSLYTEVVYPVSTDGVLHGSTTCQSYQTAGTAGYGSIAQLEDRQFNKCDECGFDINTVGRVGSASSSIDNGFEYHYRIIAAAAERYKNASREYQNQSQEAKNSAEQSFDKFENAIAALKTPRLTPKPPGRNGVVAIVLDVSAHSVPAGFTSSAVAGNATLNSRVAISACALADERASEGASILATFLDKAKADLQSQGSGTLALGAFDRVLEVWSFALQAYTRGGEALSGGLSSFLNSIPLVKSTPLASWAEQTLNDAVEAVGLQGANLDTPKPLLVNSLHVLQASNTPAGNGLLNAKQAYSALPGSASGSLGSSLVDGLLGEMQNQASEMLESEFTIFEISFGDAPGLPRIPIKIALPDQISSRGNGLLASLRSSLSSSLGGSGTNAIWE